MRLDCGERLNVSRALAHLLEIFEIFTHAKSVLKRPNFLDIPLRYAPYAGKLKFLRLFLG